MRIADIVARVVWREMGGTLRNPRLRWTRKQVMLVFVVAEDGTVGVGETWSDGGSAEPLVAFLEHDLKPRLVGRDIDLVERFWAEAIDLALVSVRRSLTWQLMSAIDVALWVLAMKRYIPLHWSLGALAAWCGVMIGDYPLDCISWPSMRFKQWLAGVSAGWTMRLTTR